MSNADMSGSDAGMEGTGKIQAVTSRRDRAEI
jgi:hypothetical protein